MLESKTLPVKIEVITIEGKQYIRALVPYTENKEQIIGLKPSSTGNSYSYATAREDIGYITFQVNAYVKKATHTDLKYMKQSEEFSKSQAEAKALQDEQTAFILSMKSLVDDPDVKALLLKKKASAEKAALAKAGATV